MFHKSIWHYPHLGLWYGASGIVVYPVQMEKGVHAIRRGPIGQSREGACEITDTN